MISTIIYYILSSSAVLFYGIGISRTIALRDKASQSFLSCIKALSTASATTAVSYIVTNWLLVPVHLSEMFPFVTLLIFLIFSVLIEIFIGVGVKKSPAEFSVTLLSIILALNEGFSVAHSVVITCSCIISFYLVIIVFSSIRSRVSFYKNSTGIKIYPVLLISLAAMILAIFGCNTAWFNVI